MVQVAGTDEESADQDVDLACAGEPGDVPRLVDAVRRDDPAHLADRAESGQRLGGVDEVLDATGAGQHVVVDEEGVLMVVGGQRYEP